MTTTAAPAADDDNSQSFDFGEMPGTTFNSLFEATAMADDLVSNAIFKRFDWMARRLESGRDIYKECGYPLSENLDVDLFRDMYDRDAIAARVVQVLPKESWQVQPSIYEDEDPETTTEFEQAWVDLHKNLRGQSWYQDEEGSPIWDYLLRADILSGIGRYGVILLGINDGLSLDQPLAEFKGLDSGSAPGTEGLYGTQPLRGDSMGYDGYTQKMLEEEGAPSFSVPGKNNTDASAKDGYEEPVGQDADGRKLIYMKVFDETCAQITVYERDANNPRFGMPQMYLVTFNDPRNGAQGGAGLPVASAHVHWSRIIHVADNAGGNDVLGYPRMKQVYNRLWDAFKTYGASGEGFWQMAFAMLSLETNPALGADFKVDVDGIREQLQKLRSGLQRHLVTAGMTAKTLPPALSDPTPYINIFIEAICIFMGCPVRVFKGSERGELASTQDDSSWNDRLAHRQKFYITPKIIVSFIDRLIVCKVLPEPEGYSVVWPDLESLSDKDKAAIALQVTQALAAYISGQVENLMTPLDYMVNVLKFPHELAKQIVESSQQAQEDEEQQTIEEEPSIEEQQAQTDASVPTHEKEAATNEPAMNFAAWKAELASARNFEEVHQALADNSNPEGHNQYTGKEVFTGHDLTLHHWIHADMQPGGPSYQRMRKPTTAEGKVMSDALSTLPTHVGVSYRGLALNAKEVAAMTRNSKDGIELKLHSSTSTDKGIALGFAKREAEGWDDKTPVLLEIHGKFKDLRDSEKRLAGREFHTSEMVAEAGSRYRFKSFKRGDEHHTVTLEQMQ